MKKSILLLLSINFLGSLSFAAYSKKCSNTLKSLKQNELSQKSALTISPNEVAKLTAEEKLAYGSYKMKFKDDYDYSDVELNIEVGTQNYINRVGQVVGYRISISGPGDESTVTYQILKIPAEDKNQLAIVMAYWSNQSPEIMWTCQKSWLY